jgi:hypothetical protein
MVEQRRKMVKESRERVEEYRSEWSEGEMDRYTA